MGIQARFLLAPHGELDKRVLLLAVMTAPGGSLSAAVMGTGAPLLQLAPGGLGRGLLLVWW